MLLSSGEGEGDSGLSCVSDTWQGGWGSVPMLEEIGEQMSHVQLGDKDSHRVLKAGAWEPASGRFPEGLQSW